jgi:hypothetical protein
MKILNEHPRRSRLLYFAGIFIFLYIGLLSRWHGRSIPAFFASYTGDYIAGWMAYCGMAVLFPKKSIKKLAIFSLVMAYALECSQLYHTPGLDRFRTTFIGHMMLGQGFLWSDLICDTAGIFSAAIAESLFLIITQRRKSNAPR